jgi:Flp pilus assembly protein TadG
VASSQRPRRQRRDRRARQAGQSLVEFSLVIPLFLVVLMAVIEFSFLMNGQLSINFATRDGALIAAEAGNAGLDAQGDDLADCVILQKIQQDVTAPANVANITQIQIYWTNSTGQPLDTSGAVTTFGSSTQAVDMYVPGSTTCTYPDSTTITVPFKETTANYASSNRCNAILGTGCQAGHTGLDTIGVLVTYNDTWKTPLHNLIGLMGSGWNLTQSNLMRMEPVL